MRIVFYSILCILGITIVATPITGKQVSMGEAVENDAALIRLHEDIRIILQMVLSAPRIQDFYHADEIPARKPLRILRNAFTQRIDNLQALGESVLWGGEKECAVQGCFVFESIRVSGDNSVDVDFSYTPENISGSAFFHREGTTWKMQSFTINER